jgi:hypothetical protein
MDMKIIRKIPCLFIAAILTVSLSAQNNDCYFKKAFSVSQGSSIIVSNKYGDINIITVKDDSVIVCATITIDQDDKEIAGKSTKLITINIGRIKDSISLSTSFDKKFFTPTYSKGRKNFSVDYLIKVPAYINIKVANEFGNLSVEELSGSANIRLSQGILTIKKLTRGNLRPLNRIYADHAKISIDESNWLDLIVQNCPSVTIGKVQALLLSSSFSKINISDVSSLVAGSKSDTYILETIKNLSSESLYSIVEVRQLTGSLKSKVTYGSINVKGMKAGSDGIDIFSDNASVNIGMGIQPSFRSDIIATNAIINFAKEGYPHLVRQEKLNTVTITGIAGDDPKTSTLIKLRITNGKLTIL